MVPAGVARVVVGVEAYSDERGQAFPVVGVAGAGPAWSRRLGDQRTFVVAEWALGLIGLYLTTAGLLNLLQAWLVCDRPSGWSTYVEGVIMVLAGGLVFFRPLLLLLGLLVIVAAALLVGGAMKLVAAMRPELGRARGGIALGGFVNVGLAVIVWWLRGSFSSVALGLVVGCYLLSEAWSTLLAPPEAMEAESLAEATNTHPDASLGLTPHAELGRRRAAAIAAARAQAPIDRYWMLTLVLVVMAIHIGRMDASLTWLGLISPAVAVGRSPGGARPGGGSGDAHAPMVPKAHQAT